METTTKPGDVMSPGRDIAGTKPAVQHPSSLLNKWLRDHPHASIAHRILHYQGDTLMAYCGRRFPADESSDRSGVILCPQCLTMSRRRESDQLRVLHGTYTRRPHNGSR